MTLCLQDHSHTNNFKREGGLKILSPFAIKKACKLKELLYEASRNSSQGLATRIDAFNIRMDSGTKEKWQETMKQSGFELRKKKNILNMWQKKIKDLDNNFFY